MYERDIKTWNEHTVHMIASWRPEGLAIFDTDAWGTLEVHPSAAADVLAGEFLRPL